MIVKYLLANLRLLFSLFLVLLTIPALILSWNAYEQLRWESFHQYQLDASSLARQIDADLSNAIKREEARSDADYTFLVLAGNPKAGFLQRSDLSKYPVESLFPGIVGYFQVDDKGIFSSPLLPLEAEQSALYGISAEEQLLRGQLEFTIRAILSENRLVASEPEEQSTLPNQAISSLNEANNQSAIGYLRESMDELVTSAPSVRSNENNEAASPEKAENVASFADSEAMAEDDADEVLPSYETPLAPEKNKASDNIEQRQLERLSVTGSRIARDKKEEKLDFNRLQSQEVQAQISKDVSALDSYSGAPYQPNIDRKKDQREEKEYALKRSNRTEKSYLPKTVVTEPGLLQDKPSVQISLFESELEPFRFSLLSSGHLVAYRQVWRDNRRLVQGAILATESFFSSAFEQRYLESSVREVASLDIAYGNRILKTYSGQSSRYTSSRRQLKGEQLFAQTLSEPFHQISLVFNVTQMPVSAGAGFISMLAISLLAIIFLGTYLLYRLALRLSLLVRQQQDFVSSVSHELKTPLTSIRMYGDILKQGWMSEDKRDEYYDYISNEAERLTRLINNVLQIAKVNRNLIQLDLKNVEVNALIDQVCSKVSSQIKQSDFNFKVNVPSELGGKLVLVDSDAFIQIMINLIDNAIKYSAHASVKQIDLVVSEGKQNSVDFSVRDYGPGIAKDQNKKIFELFYRSGNELTRECTGTGIGLALVKELTLAMKGSVKVQNLETGVAFIVSLPFATDS